MRLNCTVFRAVWVVWAALFIIVQPGDALANAKHVLLVSAYHPGFPTFFQQIDGIRAGLTENGVKPKDLVFDVEFMDSKRFFSPESEEAFRQSLSRKMAALPPYDLVFFSDDNAFNFALAHQHDLFKGIPLVFLGVNNVTKALQQNENAQMTGVIEASSFVDNVRLMQQLIPDNRDVWVISDTTPSGQSDLAALQESVRALDEVNVSILSLENLTHTEMLEKVNRLPLRAHILLLSAYRDYTGKTVQFDDHVANLLRVAPAPIFHLWEHGIGQGLIGGVVISHFEQGRRAAGLAAKVLKGTPIADLPVVAESPNVVLLDYNVIRQFQIDEDRIPENAVMINKEEDFLIRYRMMISVVGLIAAVMTVAAIWVGLYSIRLRRARGSATKREPVARLCGSGLRLVFRDG